MVVDSPLALFTTLFGWQFYNAIWFTLLGTGIALLPFLGVLIEALVTDREDGQFVGSDPVGIYKRIEAKILVMLVVVAIGAQPSSLTSIEPGTISFTSTPTLLNQNPTAVTAAAPGNTFGDTNFADFSVLDQGGVRIPLWWFAVMTVSSGINASVLAGFPELESLRDVMRLMQASYISDPVLRSETSAFFTQCYLPAKSRFERENPEGADSADISWMGSRFFLEEFRVRDGAGPIVYDLLRADRPIQGFPFNAARDIEWLPEFAPEFGKPTCSEWWLGNGAQGREGVRAQLLAETNLVQDSLVDNVVTGVTTLIPGSLGQTEIEDRIIQGVLTRDPPSITRASFGESTLEPGDGILQGFLRSFVQPGLTDFGVFAASGFFALVMDVITQVLPMVQPMLLMGIFAVLPFALVASRYSLSFLVIGAVAIFTINFWPVLWHMATWVDDNLMVAMYPSVSPQGGDESPLADLLLIRRGLIGTAGMTQITLLNMVTAGLFLLLPTIFTAVMGWAGIRAAGAIGVVMNNATNNQAVQGAASGPSRAASGVGTGGRNVATKKVGQMISK